MDGGAANFRKLAAACIIPKQIRGFCFTEAPCLFESETKKSEKISFIADFAADMPDSVCRNQSEIRIPQSDISRSGFKTSDQVQGPR
jgi:hypothetical protein